MAKKTTAKQAPSRDKRKPPPGRKWQPGVSGNPKGRPPVGKSLAEIVRRIGNEVDEKKQIRRIEVVVRAMYQTAAKGGKVGTPAAAWIADRGWGKPPQAVQIEGKDGAVVPGMILFMMPSNGRDDKPPVEIPEGADDAGDA